MASTAQAVGPLRRAQYRSITRFTAASEVIIQADAPPPRWASTARPSPSRPSCTARFGHACCGSGCPAPGPASHRLHPGSTGNDSGGSRSTSDPGRVRSSPLGDDRRARVIEPPASRCIGQARGRTPADVSVNHRSRAPVAEEGSTIWAEQPGSGSG
jgi:hypothetical protein